MISTSNQFYINIKDKPQWIPGKPFEEQSRDCQQFMVEEAKKIKKGVTIGGVRIHPWLYWHVNFWQMLIDEKIEGEPLPVQVNKVAQLRDNEWLLQQTLFRAEKENKGIIGFGARRQGKELADYEPVITPTGEVSIGDIKVGDTTYGRDGKETKVIEVFPQGEKPIYRIFLQDGRSIDCGLEHQWQVITSKGEKVLTTRQLIQKRLTYVSRSKVLYYTYKLPVNSPVQFSESELTLDPYEMGCNLMDRNPLQSVRIETEYKHSSVEQRVELLKGIFETCKSKDGVFEVDEEELAKDIIWVIRSLGYNHETNTANSSTSEMKWEIKIPESFPDINKDKGNEGVAITEIKYVGLYPATCIMVDNEDHLFLTKDFIVTHNSAFISSFTGHSATTKYGGELMVDSVIGGSQNDLDNITGYIDHGLKFIHPFFKMDMVGKDWSKGVTLGTRNSDNSKDVYSTITVTNFNKGAITASQGTAGATPKSAIFDEIGKAPFMKTFNAFKYSIETSYGWRTIPLLFGTGSVAEFSRDAQKMVNNPKTYNMITMDWSWIGADGFRKTWVEREWGVFLPAQMSLGGGIEKDRISLDKYLNIESKELSEISIDVTQWEKSTLILEQKRKELHKSDLNAYSDEVVFMPLDPDDCFLDGGKNPFPVAEANKHLNKIRLEGDTGRNVDFFPFQDNSGHVEIADSKKPIADYPFEGGIKDCAIKLFEDPPEDNSFDYTYVAGLDHYKHVESTGDSIGSLTIFKRKVNINDEFSDSVVCTYASRPPSMGTFNRMCEIIIEAYGAQCLQENADISFQQYLEAKGKDYKLLANGQEIVNRMISPDARQVNKFGLSPTPKNKEYYLNLVIAYCWEELETYINKEGEEVKILGIERIKDEHLLEEIIGFKPGRNVDRITSFGHALVWARYLDDIRVIPKVKGQAIKRITKEEYYDKVDNIRHKVRNRYGSRKYHPYRRR